MLTLGLGPPSGASIARLSGVARCGSVFPVSAVVGAAVPAAVCRWGLCPCCPGVGRCLSGVYNHHHITNNARCIAYPKGGRGGPYTAWLLAALDARLLRRRAPGKMGSGLAFARLSNLE